MSWAINQVFGNEVLTELFENNNMPVISDAFPSGYLPYPCDNGKYINIEDGETVKSKGSFRKEITKHHCEISRNSGTSNKHWRTTEIWFTSNLDFYVDNVPHIEGFQGEDVDILAKVLNQMLDNGIGAGRNHGCGQFELVSVYEIKPDEIFLDGGNLSSADLGYMTLSDYIPCESDAVDGIYTARVVRGKTTSGRSRKPLIVLNSGAMFKGAVHGLTAGRLVKDEDTGTYTSGRAIVIPVNYSKYMNS
jgi:CRISPR type III-A-associated RAMP protein Csm4